MIYCGNVILKHIFTLSSNGLYSKDISYNTYNIVHRLKDVKITISNQTPQFAYEWLINKFEY